MAAEIMAWPGMGDVKELASGERGVLCAQVVPPGTPRACYRVAGDEEQPVSTAAGQFVPGGQLLKSESLRARHSLGSALHCWWCPMRRG